MATIVVQVRRAPSRAPINRVFPEALNQAARRMGLKLSPQFQGAADPELSRYYVAEAPPGADVEAVARELKALGDVDAAYVQPEPAPPNP